MPDFVLHWKGGAKEVVTGDDITSAWKRAGHTAIMLAALDYYTEVGKTERKQPIDQGHYRHIRCGCFSCGGAG